MDYWHPWLTGLLCGLTISSTSYVCVAIDNKKSFVIFAAFAKFYCKLLSKQDAWIKNWNICELEFFVGGGGGGRWLEICAAVGHFLEALVVPGTVHRSSLLTVPKIIPNLYFMSSASCAKQHRNFVSTQVYLLWKCYFQKKKWLGKAAGSAVEPPLPARVQ